MDLHQGRFRANRFAPKSARGLGFTVFGRSIKQTYDVFSLITADSVKLIEDTTSFEFVGKARR